MEFKRVMTGLAFGLAIVAAATVVSAEMWVPGKAEDVGLTRIVPDKVILAFPEGLDALGNWEPYSSVLGNSVFLIEANTFAEGSTGDQRYGVAFQRVAGGAGVEGECFFADNGTPYRGKCNNYRQNGNPGRVAGDRRPGATNFISGCETSVHEFAPFKSDNRWNTGVIRNGRYGTVQSFSLDPTTLTQTMLCKAFDATNGRLTSGNPNTDQISRYGGDVVGLSDGNFLSVVEDRSKLHYPGGNAAVAVIFAPDGTIVKDSWVVAPGDLWSNVAAYKGGFCVRVQGMLYFHDNAGNLTGQVDQFDAPDAILDTGRGDGTRIASHINSNFVYLAGKDTDITHPEAVVSLLAFDARIPAYVAKTNVNEQTPANGGTDTVDFISGWDRINLAVDALDRIVVTSESDIYVDWQTVCRVLAFNGTTFSYLTPSFFAFVNVQDFNYIRTFRPSPSITTKQILIAAKGEINLSYDPQAQPDSELESNFYTVISHPDPQDDPTPPVGPVGPSEFSLVSVVPGAAGAVTLTWEDAGAPAGYTVEVSTSPGGPWAAAQGTWPIAATTWTSPPGALAGAQFYRVVAQ